MPAKNPGINVVLEKPLHEAIRKIAKKEGIPYHLKQETSFVKRWKFMKIESLKVSLFSARKNI
jgi:hypothetical protein